MDDVLIYGVVISAVVSLFALAYLLLITLKAGIKPFYSTGHGKSSMGIVYALSMGLAPWEKESAAKHLPTYISGILYHLGIFTGMAYTIAVLFQLSFSLILLRIIQIFLGAGILNGIGLLFKRILVSYMKKISYPDDYLSNILVDIFLFLALLDTIFLEIRSFYLLCVIILFLYIPVGKIRHCFFFFFSRILFGRYYGRRGVLPHKQRASMEKS
jgi:hypothetical protein